MVNHLVRREEYLYTFSVDFIEPAFSVRAGMMIKTLTGMELGGAVSLKAADVIPSVEAGTRLKVRFKFKCLLLPGTYFLNAGVEGVIDGVKTYLDRCIDAVMFKVQHKGDQIPTGVVDFCIEPTMEYKEEQFQGRMETG